MELQGTKVVLRPHRLSDAPVYLRWMKDPAVVRYTLQNGQQLTLAQERAWIRARQKSRTEAAFGIWSRHERLVGTIALTHLTPHRGDFGIILGEKTAWGKGYAADTMRVILAYGFQKLGLRRVELTVDPANTRAKRLYRHLGFRREGLLRAYHQLPNGTLLDVEIWALLDWEWGKRKEF